MLECQYAIGYTIVSQLSTVVWCAKRDFRKPTPPPYKVKHAYTHEKQKTRKSVDYLQTI